MSVKSDMAKAIHDISEICKVSTAGSVVFRDGDQGYQDSLAHYIDSSIEPASLAVEPGNESDLASMISIIAKYKVPFAIKGGGHSMVPAFSSTRGIHISMVRFSTVVYNEVDQTVAVGAGCLWQTVHKAIVEYNRNVVGGHRDMGVAGWLLGGGYSFKSSNYGLGIDNVIGYRIILPSGEIKVATLTLNRDLFHALRGGGNNFGVVTEFTLKTHYQGPIYGASLTISRKDSDKVKRAIVGFISKETRKEASILASFRHILLSGQRKPTTNISVLCLFDGQKPENEDEIPFKEFRDIIKESQSSDPVGWSSARHRLSVATKDHTGDSTERTIDLSEQDDGFCEMSYGSVQQILHHPYDLVPFYDDDARIHGATDFSLPLPNAGKGPGILRNETPGDMMHLGQLKARGRFACIMVSKYTKKLVNTIEKESAESAKQLVRKQGEMVQINVWPFHAKLFENSPAGAAWPHDRDTPFAPLFAYFRWKHQKDDDFWIGEMNRALKIIYHVALNERCTTMDYPYYSNMSLENTPVHRIYQNNIGMLSGVRAKYDPENIMDMTGGFRIPLPNAGPGPELPLDL